MAEKIVWTVLPHGFDARGQLRVSIVMSPRLTPDAGHENQQALLSGWPDFLDWPKALAQIGFQLKIDGITYKLKLDQVAESALWTRLFTPDMSVAPFVFTDMSQHNLNSFPVRHVVRFLKDHYGDLAAQQGLQRPSLFPIDGSPLGPMIKSAAGGERYNPRIYLQRRPNGIGDLLVNGAIDERVRGMYFGKDIKEVPPTVRGIDGKPTANKKHTPIRALPADLPGSLSPLFNASAPAYALYQANRFYSRPETKAAPYREQPDPASKSQPIKPPAYDFHQVVASFSDAPSLMRRLGLVIDATVEASGDLVTKAKTTAGGTQGLMQLAIQRRSRVHGADSTPQTAWQMSGTRFVVRSRDNHDHRDGLLALQNVTEVVRTDDAKGGNDRLPFNVVQVDADGSSVKTINFVNSTLTLLQSTPYPDAAEALERAGGATYTTNENQESVPALRSGGLTLTRHNRASDTAQDLASNALKSDALDDAGQSAQVVLFAEDVLRGYRVDVRENRTAKWRSLCARVATYRATKDRSSLGGDVHDEGFVHATSTTTQAAPDDVNQNKGTQDHYLHEALFKWTGWSLVAARPGRRIVPVNEHGLIQEETVKAQSDDDSVGGASPVLTTTTWQPGTLPRLRFGETYRLRARLVDLAGNSLGLDDGSLGDLEQATEEITYRRLEPLDPPALALFGRLSEGESLERAVIRSDVIKTDSGYQSLSTSQYIQQGAYATNDPGKSGFAYVDTNIRHVVPPKGSQTLAEHHGCFDKAFDAASQSGGAAIIRQAYELITKREAGTLYDGGASVKLITPPVDNVSTEQPLDPAPPEGFRLQPGQYVVHSEKHLATPYLPDPLAAAIVLRGVPGLTGPTVLDATDNVHADYIPFTKELVLYVPLKGSWPDIDGFRIAMAELPEAIDAVPCVDAIDPNRAVPTWSGGDRVLTIYLRKGEIAPVRYASAVRLDMMTHMALPAWTANAYAGIWTAILAICGSNWMMTPDRTLTLVHATQHPVCEPTFRNISVRRPEGATFADFGRETFVRYHARSTGQLEVLGEWMEWVDDPTSGKSPYRRHMTARLKPVALAQPGIDESEPHLSDYAILGPEPALDQARPHIRHDFGDQKFRFLRYSLLATTRFREYLPPSITADLEQITRQGAPYLRDALSLPPGYYDETIDAASIECAAPLLASQSAPQGYVVPASGRPQPPQIAYIVPTQHWTDTDSNGVHRVIRDGGTLRVYLERPWFTSGDGELLGVIVTAAPPDARKLAELKGDPSESYVTQWGLDPLFDSTLPRGTLTASAFPQAVCVQNVRLPDANHDVVVAGHRVYFDGERNQWFADIRIDAGDSYMPFVRLSLVRFQPWAIDNAHISTPVPAPFAQLLPRRRVDVTHARDTYLFNVYGPVPLQGPASSWGLYPSPAFSAFVRDVFGPGPGHNRIEVVLQWQNTTHATDLDWFDVPNAPHPSADATPQQAAVDFLHQIGATALTGFDHVRATAETSPQVALTRSTASAANQAMQLTHLTPDFLAQLVALDTCVWTGRISLPADVRGKRLRLMLREYERHFSDDQVKVAPFNITQPKVVERLVFAREFPVTLTTRS